MSLSVFFVVIASSLFQTWWNFHLKKTSADKASFLMVGWFIFGVIATPISYFALNIQFSSSWWPFILSTGIAQGLYLLALTRAYAVADISLVFPIARGLSIAFTALVISAFGLNELSPTGILGIGLVVLGAVALGSYEIRNKKARQGLILAFLLGLLVASYTVVDSLGAQKIPIVFYVLVMNVAASVFAFPFLYQSRKKQIVEVLKYYKWQGFWVGFAGSVGYLIVIWAYTQAPAPYIVALREISIVFATLLGVYVLKEPMYLRKIFGVAMILAGILIVRLA
ncbi:MAG: DMT family transporter [Bdellovibrionales bacterium]|nr:DMT family transporter [Bdellovibrionales bacterium]